MNNRKPDKLCEICGKHFRVAYWPRKYDGCSKKCRSINRSNHTVCDALLHSVISCSWCGKNFIPKRATAKTCSPSCARSEFYRHRKNTIKCAVCGVVVHRNGPCRTCGSEKCKAAYKLQKFGTIEQQKERHLKREKILRDRNKEKTNKKTRDRYANSPKLKAQHRERKHRRKALILSATIGTDARAGYLAASKAKACHWCGRKLTHDNLEVDHVHPLSRGGAHAAYNLVASCSFCNRSRQAKLTTECRSIKQPELMFA